MHLNSLIFHASVWNSDHLIIMHNLVILEILKIDFFLNHLMLKKIHKKNHKVTAVTGLLSHLVLKISCCLISSS